MHNKSASTRMNVIHGTDMSKPNIVYASNCILIKCISCKYYIENYLHKTMYQNNAFLLKKTTSNSTWAIKNVRIVLLRIWG